MPDELKFKLPVRVDGLNIVDADGRTIVDARDSHFFAQDDPVHLAHIAKCLNERAGLLRALEIAAKAIDHLDPKREWLISTEALAALKDVKEGAK